MTIELGVIVGAITVLNFILTIAVLSSKITRQAGLSETSLLKAIADERDEINMAMQQHERLIGETITAMRTKIADVEIYVRDTFVRRDSFYEMMRGVRGDIAAMSDKIEARLIRMEDQIQAVRQKSHQQPTG